jgi:hypothetical protein
MISIGGSLPAYLGNALPSSLPSSGVRRASRNGAGASGEDVAQQLAADAGNGTANPAASDGSDASSANRGQAPAAAKSAGGAGSAAASSQDPQLAAEISRLQTTDRAVRAHEAAHVAAGGSYVQGAASFTYQTGPTGNGTRWAARSRSMSRRADPEATIQKMEIVRAQRGPRGSIGHGSRGGRFRHAGRGGRPRRYECRGGESHDGCCAGGARRESQTETTPRRGSHAGGGDGRCPRSAQNGFGNLVPGYAARIRRGSSFVPSGSLMLSELLRGRTGSRARSGGTGGALSRRTAVETDRS